MLGGIYGIAAVFSPPPVLRGNDAVARPGERVDVTIWVEQDLAPLLRWELAGVAVSLTREPFDADTPVHRGETDGKGVARVTFDAPADPGAYRYRVRRGQADAGDRGGDRVITLQVIPPDTGVVVTTIGGTLSSAVGGEGPEDLVLSSPRRLAVDALTEVAASRALVYVPFDGRSSREKIHGWLERSGFPDGAVLVPPRQPGAGASARWRVVAEFLELAVARRWPQTSWGVGSTPSEMLAFHTAGLRPLHVGVSTPPPADGPSVKAAPDWKAAAKVLLEDH